jgi:hypothetical protein
VARAKRFQPDRGRPRISVAHHAELRIGVKKPFPTQHGLCLRRALEAMITFRPKTLPRRFGGPAQDLNQTRLTDPCERATLYADVKELLWLPEL